MNPSTLTSRALTIILSFSPIVLLMLGPCYQLRAGDWPQILGPQRSGQAMDERPLASSWDATSPKLLWRVAVNSGYAGAVVSAGHAYLFDRDPQNERLTSVDLKTGKQQWQAKWPATYSSSMDPDSGPRAVPTVAQNMIVCYGAAGDLVCVESSNGKIVWARPLRKELVADDGYFGAGSSPLVIDGVVVANIGGKKGGIVGVDLKSGKTLWQATAYEASYSSPVAVKTDGQSAALVVTRLHTVLLDPKSGKVFSEISFGGRGPTVNAATPLKVDDNLYLLTASYNIGAHLLRIRGTQLERVWKNTDLLASQYNSPVLIGDIVVGVNGREDLGEVVLKGLQINQQSVNWQEPLTGTTHLIAVGDQLLQVVINGNVRLSRVTAKGVETTAEFALPQTNQPPSAYRALPALSDHILIVRRTQDATHGEFIAYQLP